jgi:HK97 family phage prohead protease
MISKDRCYRHFEVRAQEEEGMFVEGYAAVFDHSTVMFEYDGVEYKEVICRGAFDKAQMSDVVMNFDHQGKPVARTKNSTLTLTVDDYGLKVRADLSGTTEARELYNEIKAGYVDKMSFAFTIAKSSYDKETHTRGIERIKRLYDVAAVSFPAYESTSLEARSFFEAEAEKERAEARKQLDLAIAKYKYLEVKK